MIFIYESISCNLTFHDGMLSLIALCIAMIVAFLREHDTGHSPGVDPAPVHAKGTVVNPTPSSVPPRSAPPPVRTEGNKDNTSPDATGSRTKPTTLSTSSITRSTTVGSGDIRTSQSKT